MLDDPTQFRRRQDSNKATLAAHQVCVTKNPQGKRLHPVSKPINPDLQTQTQGFCKITVALVQAKLPQSHCHAR